jgi:superfamily I DNA/RNA helicase
MNKEILSKEQEFCVNHEPPHQRFLILAGAGAGKTKVMVERALLHSKRKNVWITTFTKNAAKEIESRLFEKRFDHRVKVKTIDGLFAELIEQFEEEQEDLFLKCLGIEKNFRSFSLFSEEFFFSRLLPRVEAWIANLESVHLRLELLGEMLKKASSYQLSPIQKLCQLLLTEECLNDELEIKHLNLPFSSSDLAQFWSIGRKAFQERLNERCVTFLDLTLSLKMLLKKLSLKEKPDEIIVDEYQDTNYLQHEIFEKLAEAGNLIVVGDPKQSLYSFRYAQVDIINNLQQNKNWSQAKLLTNYRSTKYLVEFINDFSEVLFSSTPVHPDFKSSYVAYDPMKAYRLGGETAFIENSSGSEPTNQRTFQALIHQIKRNSVKYSLEKQVVLAEKHSQLQTISKWLHQENIPHSYVGRGILEEQKTFINQIQAILKLLSNQATGEDWFLVLNSDLLQVEPSEVPLEKWGDDPSLFAWLGLNQELEFLQKKFLKKPFETLKDFLRLSEIRINVVGQKEIWQNFQRKAEPYWLRFYQVLKNDYEPNDLFDRLNIFFQMIHSQRENLHQDPFTDLCEGLSLSTIHGAKGLEWDVVYFWPCLKESKFLVSDFFQQIRSNRQVTFGWLDSSKDVIKIKKTLLEHEKQRLYYTALTRAKEVLMILSPWQRANAKKNFQKAIDGDGDLTLFAKTLEATHFYKKLISQDRSNLLVHKASFKAEEKIQKSDPFYFSICSSKTSFQSQTSLSLGERGHHLLEIDPYRLDFVKMLGDQSLWLKTEWEIWHQSYHGLQRFVLDAFAFLPAKSELPFWKEKIFQENFYFIFEFKFGKPKDSHRVQLKNYLSICKKSKRSPCLGALLYLDLNREEEIILNNSLSCYMEINGSLRFFSKNT